MQPTAIQIISWFLETVFLLFVVVFVLAMVVLGIYMSITDPVSGPEMIGRFIGQ